MTLHALLADVIWDLEKAGQTVLASRILEDSRGKVLAALVEAAVRIDDFLENELVMFSDPDDPISTMGIGMRLRLEDEGDDLHDAVDAYLALEKP